MAEVVLVHDPAEGGELAAELIARLVARTPDAVLGLATGSTPLPLWKALAARSLDLGRVRGFALDEYIGLPGRAPGELPLGHHARCRRASRARSGSGTGTRR